MSHAILLVSVGSTHGSTQGLSCPRVWQISVVENFSWSGINEKFECRTQYLSAFGAFVLPEINHRRGAVVYSVTKQPLLNFRPFCASDYLLCTTHPSRRTGMLVEHFTWHVKCPVQFSRVWCQPSHHVALESEVAKHLWVEDYFRGRTRTVTDHLGLMYRPRSYKMFFNLALRVSTSRINGGFTDLPRSSTVICQVNERIK